jgi:hypothetical protein
MNISEKENADPNTNYLRTHISETMTNKIGILHYINFSPKTGYPD